MADEHEHTERDKLKIVLPHLLKHNQEHIKEMQRLAGKTGSRDVEEELMKVIFYAEKINRHLSNAINKL